MLGFEFGVELDALQLPCPLSLVIVWHEGRCLLVFDRWKRAWELPGGVREVGESAEAAALRELAEETGIEATGLEYVGVARFRLASDGREEYGAVYTTEVGVPPVFEANDEIARVRWWDPAVELAGADRPDTTIVQLVRAR